MLAPLKSITSASSRYIFSRSSPGSASGHRNPNSDKRANPLAVKRPKGDLPGGTSRSLEISPIRESAVVAAPLWRTARCSRRLISNASGSNPDRIIGANYNCPERHVGICGIFRFRACTRVRHYHLVQNSSETPVTRIYFSEHVGVGFPSYSRWGQRNVGVVSNFRYLHRSGFPDTLELIYKGLWSSPWFAFTRQRAVSLNHSTLSSGFQHIKSVTPFSISSRHHGSHAQKARGHTGEIMACYIDWSFRSIWWCSLWVIFHYSSRLQIGR